MVKLKQLSNDTVWPDFALIGRDLP